MLWIELALAAAAGAALTTLQTRKSPAPAVSRAPGTSATPPRAKHWALLACYGAFGFGYIVPATFLPAMAREQVADPRVFGLTWPLFGLATALSVAAASHWLAAWPRRGVWALAQWTMASGTAVVLFSQSMWALAACAVLVGGTFMVATMAGLQLAREYDSENPTPLLARMTAAFATGQIVGPLLVRVLGTERIAGQDAFWWANAAATLLLAATGTWLALGTRARSQLH